MKNYFIKILILVITIPCYRALGQSTIQEAQYKNGDVALFKFLNKKFSEEAKKHSWPSCTISVVFAKFTIDSTGNVKNLTFSELKETPEVFKTMLGATILATSGAWIPRQINNKKLGSRPFILPLIYEMEAGCNPKDVALDNTKQPYKSVPNGLSTALLYMLNFEDNAGSNPNQLDCVILRPLHIFSIN